MTIGLNSEDFFDGFGLDAHCRVPGATKDDQGRGWVVEVTTAEDVIALLEYVSQGLILSRDVFDDAIIEVREWDRWPNG